jgi:hypothetical protein
LHRLLITAIVPTPLIEKALGKNVIVAWEIPCKGFTLISSVYFDGVFSTHRCRTNLFFKEQKQYSSLVFGISMMMFLALGAYTWAPADQVNPSPSLPSPPYPFIYRGYWPSARSG